MLIALIVAGGLYFFLVSKPSLVSNKPERITTSTKTERENLAGPMPGWSYRRQITISNTSTSNTLRDYQVLITLDTASLISTGKMQNNGADIRFTDSDGTTLLSYWIESGINTPSTKIWVKVPNIPASSTKTIYRYYGNPSAASISNPKTTMFVYEDMETPLSGNLAGSAIYDPTNKWIRLTPASNHSTGYLYYNNPGSQGFYAKFEFWSGGGNGADAIWLGVYDSNYADTEEDVAKGGYHFTFDEYQDRILFTKDVPISEVGEKEIDNSKWHLAEIYYWKSDNTVYANVYYDGVLRINASDNSPPLNALNGSGLMVFGGRTGALTNEHRIKNIIVRKYTSPEPTVFLGVEELITP